MCVCVSTESVFKAFSSLVLIGLGLLFQLPPTEKERMPEGEWMEILAPPPSPPPALAQDFALFQQWCHMQGRYYCDMFIGFCRS